MEDINELLTEHTLYIDSTLEEFINNFCNTTGFVKTLTSERFLLGSWYEGYLYCLLIGINTNKRHFEGYSRKLEKARSWSSAYKEQYKYCIGKIIYRPDILKELNIDERDMIDIHFEDRKTLLDKIKVICDQYSLGGVRYLQEKYELDDNFFHGYAALKRIYEETLLIK